MADKEWTLNRLCVKSFFSSFESQPYLYLAFLLWFPSVRCHKRHSSGALCVCSLSQGSMYEDASQPLNTEPTVWANGGQPLSFVAVSFSARTTGNHSQHNLYHDESNSVVVTTTAVPTGQQSSFKAIHHVPVALSCQLIVQFKRDPDKTSMFLFIVLCALIGRSLVPLLKV